MSNMNFSYYFQLHRQKLPLLPLASFPVHFLNCFRAELSDSKFLKLNKSENKFLSFPLKTCKIIFEFWVETYIINSYCKYAKNI